MLLIGGKVQFILSLKKRQLSSVFVRLNRYLTFWNREGTLAYRPILIFDYFWRKEIQQVLSVARKCQLKQVRLYANILLKVTFSNCPRTFVVYCLLYSVFIRFFLIHVSSGSLVLRWMHCCKLYCSFLCSISSPNWL